MCGMFRRFELNVPLMSSFVVWFVDIRYVWKPERPNIDQIEKKQTSATSSDTGLCLTAPKNAFSVFDTKKIYFNLVQIWKLLWQRTSSIAVHFWLSKHLTCEHCISFHFISSNSFWKYHWYFLAKNDFSTLSLKWNTWNDLQSHEISWA